MIPEPLPAWLTTLTRRLDALNIFGANIHANHVLINEYTSGQGIMPHEDGPAYTPVVANVTLGSHTLLEFFEKGSKAAAIAEKGAAIVIPEGQEQEQAKDHKEQQQEQHQKQDLDVSEESALMGMSNRSRSSSCGSSSNINNNNNNTNTGIADVTDGINAATESKARRKHKFIGSILLEPRSLVIFADDMYLKLHGIEERTHDVIDETVLNLDCCSDGIGAAEGEGEKKKKEEEEKEEKKKEEKEEDNKREHAYKTGDVLKRGTRISLTIRNVPNVKKVPAALLGKLLKS